MGQNNSPPSSAEPWFFNCACIPKMPTSEAEFHALFDISPSAPDVRVEMNIRPKEKKIWLFFTIQPCKLYVKP